MTHTLVVTYTSPTGPQAQTYTATGDINLEEDLTIAPLASAAETDMTVLYSSLQSFWIMATAAMTAVFKSGTGGTGTTEATFTLTANVPQFYIVNAGISNPFSGNAGQVLVTSTPGGTLHIRGLMQV